MNINFESWVIGPGTIIEPTASIQGLKGTGKRLEIGSNCYIGENVNIMVDEFELGDYGRIHHNTDIHGYQPCKIGHNAWIGQFCILDSIGGLTIGHNVGIGAHSQLWSHIKYGDTLEGCLWNTAKPLIIEDDVWFVGHCIVSPITAKARAMALVGSVVTKDMKENMVYAGVPARNTGKFQFSEFGMPGQEKYVVLSQWMQESGVDHKKIEICLFDDAIGNKPDVSYFSVESRRYTKKGTTDEVAFMKFLLPEKAKFIPFNTK